MRAPGLPRAVQGLTAFVFLALLGLTQLRRALQQVPCALIVMQEHGRSHHQLLSTQFVRSVMREHGLQSLPQQPKRCALIASQGNIHRIVARARIHAVSVELEHGPLWHPWHAIYAILVHFRQSQGQFQ